MVVEFSIVNPGGASPEGNYVFHLAPIEFLYVPFREKALVYNNCHRLVTKLVNACQERCYSYLNVKFEKFIWWICEKY